MNKLLKQYGPYAAAIVIIIVAIILANTNKKPSENGNQNPQTGTEINKQSISPSPETQKPQQSFWEGTLQKSTNDVKGNYTLTTKDHLIYLKTSRDFDSLVGKKVKVTYQGTLESFMLGDITLAE